MGDGTPAVKAWWLGLLASGRAGGKGAVAAAADAVVAAGAVPAKGGKGAWGAWALAWSNTLSDDCDRFVLGLKIEGLLKCIGLEGQIGRGVLPQADRPSERATRSRPLSRSERLGSAGYRSRDLRVKRRGKRERQLSPTGKGPTFVLRVLLTAKHATDRLTTFIDCREWW
jgi:hypothetical protein